MAVIDNLIKMFSYLNKKLDDVIDLLGFGHCSLQLAVGSSAIDFTLSLLPPLPSALTMTAFDHFLLTS